MRAVSIQAACCSALMLVALAGCGGGGSIGAPTSLAASAPAAQTSNKSTQLSVSGAPQATVSSGQAYSFTPAVSNASGTVTFSVQNAPRWASFNASTGQLSGTPQAGDAGTYADIVISVSNGQASATLPSFSITVAEAGSASGSADISWTPPTTNTNGTTLTDLGGYYIYYGTSASSLTQKVQVTNIGLTSYEVGGLTAGTWYFAVAAYTTSGAQSSLSNVVSTTIS